MSAEDGGRTVGRYRILDFLGAGAMGEVYLAEDPQIERRLAIKTVRLVGRPQEIEERKRRLLREARAAGRLLHPNVVTLFDAGEAAGVLYLAFEFVAGTDLAGRLESGPPLSLREVLRIVRQVADALDFAHRQGIVHRDIKPSNILLDSAGRVKVADFGIAKMTGQSTELTVAGSVMGSPQYLSPEQIRGDELDGRSDIFSLGVVLYELLSKRRPFDGDTITTLVYQILHNEPPPISALRAVPERLEGLLRRMLAKSRDERFATAGEVAAEIVAIERELSDETLSAPAADLPAQATQVLPKRPSPSPSDIVPGPPPAAGAAVAKPATVPPPLPPSASAAAAALPPPQAPAPRSGQPGQGARLALALALVAVLGAAALGAAAWWLYFRPRAQTEAMLGVPPTTPTPVSSSASSPGTEPVAAPPVAVTSPPPPVSSPPAPTPTPAVRPGELVRQTPPSPNPRQRPPQTSPQTSPQTPLPARTPAPEPAPERGRQAVPPVVPSPAAEDRDSEEPARPSEPAADLVLPSGLELAFRPTPADAFVLVDGTQIGRATEWSGQKGGRTFTLSPGEHRIKLRSQGMKDFHILVQAREAAGVTPVLARLKPLPAAQADAADLKLYQVREAVAFKVDVPGANILVDGQPAGTAQQFGGRFAQPGSWLRLDRGRHRVSVVAPGGRRQDFLVEVGGGADKDKDRIEVSLRGEG